jgi:hypothetical protein
VTRNFAYLVRRQQDKPRRCCLSIEQLIGNQQIVGLKSQTLSLKGDYIEVRAYLEKEHPNWLRALTPPAYKRASRLLATKVLADAELREHP